MTAGYNRGLEIRFVQASIVAVSGIVHSTLRHIRWLPSLYTSNRTIKRHGPLPDIGAHLIPTVNITFMQRLMTFMPICTQRTMTKQRAAYFDTVYSIMPASAPTGLIRGFLGRGISSTTTTS